MKLLKFVVLAVLALSVFGMNQSVSAGFHRFWGGPFWGPTFAYPAYDLGFYGYYGWDACCAPVAPCCEPVAEPCCAPAAPVAAAPVVAAPVADCATCGPFIGYGYPVSYAIGWRPGPIRRLLFGRYRWYATSYVGGFYYTPDCCEPSYGVIEGEPVQNAPTPAPTPAPAQQAPTQALPVTPDQPAGGVSILNNNNIYHQTSFTQKEATPENSGIVTISVPEDAVVYVNDVRTTAEGTSRTFVSFGLTAGNEYDYVIRAEVTRNGQMYVETRVVTLTAGKRDSISFVFPQISNPTDQVVSM